MVFHIFSHTATLVVTFLSVTKTIFLCRRPNHRPVTVRRGRTWPSSTVPFENVYVPLNGHIAAHRLSPTGTPKRRDHIPLGILVLQCHWALGFVSNCFTVHCVALVHNMTYWLTDCSVK